MTARILRLLCALGVVAASSAPASATWIRVGGLETIRGRVVLNRSTFLDDGEHGWVGGKTASRPWSVVIFRTSDGGRSWERFDTGVRASSVADLEFVDASNGWMTTYTDRRLLRTSDGGASWTEEDVLGGWEFTRIVDVAMLSASRGYAVGEVEGQAALFEYRVTRAGRPPWWRPQLPGGGGRLGNLAVHSADWMWMFAADMRGLEARAFRRAGSADFVPIGGLDGFPCVWSLFFLDREHGWLGGLFGAVRYTRNGGARWAVRDTGSTGAIKGIHFTSVRQGRAISGPGEILETSDGGLTWTVIEDLGRSLVDLDHFGGQYFVTAVDGLFYDADVATILRPPVILRGGGRD